MRTKKICYGKKKTEPPSKVINELEDFDDGLTEEQWQDFFCGSDDKDLICF